MVVLAFNPSTQETGRMDLCVRPLCLQSELQDKRNPVLENEFLWVTTGIFPVPVLPHALTPRGFCFWGPQKSVLAVKS